MVNSAIVAYFIDDLQINKHFNLFKKLLFMEDGEFSLSLSNQLFEKVFEKHRKLVNFYLIPGPRSSLPKLNRVEVFGEKFDIKFGYIHADVKDINFSNRLRFRQNYFPLCNGLTHFTSFDSRFFGKRSARVLPMQT